MPRLCVVSLVLLSTVSSLAAADLAWVCDARNIPPPEFDVGYDSVADDVYLLWFEAGPLRAYCGVPASYALDYAACTWFDAEYGQWTMALRIDLTPEQEACTLRHEAAHTVGWHHDNDPLGEE